VSFLATIERARAFLQRNGRVSLAALRRAFDLDEPALESLVEELVDVQQIAALDGKVLTWMGPAGAPSAERTAADSAADATAPPVANGGERRLLTVLFCDLVDSTRLASHLDPEDWQDVLHVYRDAATGLVERFGGTVAQHLGDGILVYFGWQLAHEDDAERAVRAGLGIVDAVAECNPQIEEQQHLRLGVRIGIHTGPVVMSEIGAGAHRETLALGDAVNLAGRLQGIAEPNTVAISEETLRLTRGLFLTKDRGLQTLKGISDPVRVFRVMGRSTIRSRLDGVPDQSLTPLVGRERELEGLVRFWEKAVHGQGQAVFLRGEAGVGKTRLLRALQGRLSSTPHNWFDCFCSPFAMDTAFFPILELVRQLFGQAQTPKGDDRIKRLEAVLQRVDVASLQSLPLFAELLGLPQVGSGPEHRESPERLRRRTLTALVAWVLRSARERPTVVVVEDVHWSDPSTRRLIGLLLDRLATSRLLCIFTHRPEFSVPWRDHADVACETIPALSPDESEQLAGAMDQSLGLPAEVLRLIAARSDGIPLFIEELVKAATIRGRSEDDTPLEHEIPTSLQASLTARLDCLGRAKGMAQLAAALGREFSRPLLAAVANKRGPELHTDLARLVDAGILVRGDGTEETYSFWHSLIQEAAHQSLLKRQRGPIHARIARALEDLFPDRVARHPEILAQHLFEAGDFLRAAAGLDGAGRLAAAHAAYEEAIAHYRRGLAATQRAAAGEDRDRREVSLLIMLGNAIMATKGYGAPEIISVWDQAAELAERVGDSEELSSALNGAAVYHMQTGDCAAAVQHAERILDLAQRENIRIAALRGHGTLAQARFYMGDFERALEHAYRSIACYEPGDFERVTYGSGYDQAVIAHGAAALAHWWLGNFDRSLEVATEGVEIARSVRSSQSLAMALSFLSFAYYLRRELDQALRTAGEVKVLARELSFPVWHGLALLISGAVRARLDRDPGALDEMHQGLALLGGTNDQSGESFAFGLLAEAHWKVGQEQEALSFVESGLRIAEEQGQPYYRSELLRLKGQMLLEHGDVQVCEALLRESLADARHSSARGSELRSALSLARLLVDRGRPLEAREILSHSLGDFREGRSTPDVQAAWSTLRSLESP